MKLLLPFALLLAALTAAPAFQTAKGKRDARSSESAKSGPKVARATVVCMDPGHPSETSSGAVVQNGTSEVEVAWAVALKLKGLLEARGYEVCMTKGGERQLVENRARAQVANRERAALLVRLHCDASADEGFAVYYPDRQGKTQGVVGPSAGVIEASRRAAEAISAGMSEGLEGALKDGGVRGDSLTFVGSRQGALTGSIFSEVPVVTIEMVVLSNARDAEFIKSEEGQRRMAQAIADGVSRFVEPPPQKRIASPRK